MNIYLLEEATANYYRQKNKLNYPIEAFEQGTAFENCIDTDVIKVFDTKGEALKELESYTTCYDELSDGGRNYLQVTEYRINECEFDLGEAVEEEDYKSVDECLKAFRSNIKGFWDYIDYNGWSLGYSIGTLHAWVKVEKEENGRTNIDYIKKDFTNSGDFNAYEQAEEWSNSKFEEIKTQEESTNIYAADCNVSY